MPTLSFEGENHAAIVAQVRAWLADADLGPLDDPIGRLTTTEAVERTAELTKDALRVIAAAAPEPVASNELFRSLTALGHKATEQTAQAVVGGLDALEELTGGGVVQKAEQAGRTLVWEMNTAVARQLLKALRR